MLFVLVKRCKRVERSTIISFILKQEVSVTVRPQHKQSSGQRSSRKADSQSEKAEQARMRSSIALEPTDEVIQAKQAAR